MRAECPVTVTTEPIHLKTGPLLTRYMAFSMRAWLTLLGSDRGRFVQDIPLLFTLSAGNIDKDGLAGCT